MKKFMLGLALLLSAGWTLLDTPQAAQAQRFGISIGSGGRYGGNRGGGWYGNNWYGNNWYGNNWNNRYRGYPGYGYGNGIYIAPNLGRSSYYYNPTPSYYYDPTPSYYVAPVQTGTFTLEVRVPSADAKVWFNNVDSGQSGTTRWFETSNLTVGQPYTFQAEARWMEDGREVVDRRQVTGRAGDSQRIDFLPRKAVRTGGQ